jgi:hypothetical protein
MQSAIQQANECVGEFKGCGKQKKNVVSEGGTREEKKEQVQRVASKGAAQLLFLLHNINRL